MGAGHPELVHWHAEAYETELMPPARATELAEKFISLLPERRRWFGNEWVRLEDLAGLGPLGTELTHPDASHPCTYRTFDAGLIAVADGRAWIAWFTDED